MLSFNRKIYSGKTKTLPDQCIEKSELNVLRNLMRQHLNYIIRFVQSKNKSESF